MPDEPLGGDWFLDQLPEDENITRGDLRELLVDCILALDPREDGIEQRLSDGSINDALLVALDAMVTTQEHRTTLSEIISEWTSNREEDED